MSENSFLKFCGISSILGAIAYIGTVVFSMVAGVSTPEDLAGMSTFLQNWYDNKILMSAYGWCGILGSLFTLPLIVGMYQVLRKQSPWQWVPVAIIFHGVFLLTIAYIIPLVISFSLAPNYVAETDASLLSSIMTTTLTLRVVEDICVKVGTILTLPTGISLMAIFDWKDSQFPRGINILSIIIGIVSLSFLGTFSTSGLVYTIFYITSIVSLGLMLLWMFAIGLVMILPMKSQKNEENEK